MCEYLIRIRQEIARIYTFNKLTNTTSKSIEIIFFSYLSDISHSVCLFVFSPLLFYWLHTLLPHVFPDRRELLLKWCQWEPRSLLTVLYVGLFEELSTNKHFALNLLLLYHPHTPGIVRQALIALPPLTLYVHSMTPSKWAVGVFLKAFLHEYRQQ